MRLDIYLENFTLSAGSWRMSLLKTINVTFEDAEFEKLVKVKDGLSWQAFIVKAADAYSQFSIKKEEQIWLSLSVAIATLRVVLKNSSTSQVKTQITLTYYNAPDAPVQR